jgi:sec-independent protein translocase protein TatA
MLGLGTNELLIIGGIVVLLFGGAKLSQLGKGLGEGIREFKNSMQGEERTTRAASVSSPSTPSEEANSVSPA